MASYTGNLDYVITDVNGDTAQMHVRISEADTVTIAQLATLATALGGFINPITNGKVTKVGVSLVFLEAQISAGTAPPPASATYPSVTDGAALTFLNSSAGRRKIVVPAPLLSDFIANSNTVNPSQADMANFISQIEGLPDLGGSTNLYEGGVKVGRHSRRRVTRKHL